MTLANTKNGLGIMLGLYGDEFWRVSGGVKYAFYSKKQIDEGKSLNCRAKKTYDFLYSTWDDKIRERVIHNLEFDILACNDPILRSLYSKKPPPFVPEEFINRRGMKIEVSDVFAVKVYPRLDSLRKELVAKYPDVEFRGIVVDSSNFDAMCEKKRQHKDFVEQIAKKNLGGRVSNMKEDFIRNCKSRAHESREKIDKINHAASAMEISQIWFQTDFQSHGDVKGEESVIDLHNRRMPAKFKKSSRDLCR